MAIYRNVQLSFWTDNKIEDDFTPEDKYFYLYLLTNPQTNLCGCYEVSYSQLTNQTGYSKDTINRLIDRFENVHKVIRFNKSTKEMLILHWYKYNWSKSEKTLTGVENVAKHIKCEEFREYVFELVECIRNDAPFPQNRYPIQASVSDTDTDSVTVSITDKDNSNKDIYIEVISYLNMVLGTNYKPTTRKTQEHINARLHENYTIEDFKTVIDKKAREWQGTSMEKFLRPETLFGTKFESYLNQNIVEEPQNNKKARQPVDWSKV